ncbi:MAG: hypothetical protein ACRCZM_02955 [Bacteroidales bacterium]
MKYLFIFIASILGLCSCSQHDFASSDDYNQEVLKRGGRFQIQKSEGLEISIDSCVIDGFIGDFSRVSFGGEDMIIKGGHRVEAVELGAFKDSLTFSFYFTQNGSNEIFTDVVTDDLDSEYIYTWLFSGDGDKVIVDLSIEPWLNGGVIEVSPDSFAYSIDIEKSNIPSYVRFSDNRDTIYVPSCDGELILVLDVAMESHMLLQGDDLDVVQLKGEDYLDNRYMIRFVQKGILDPTRLSRLYFGEKGSGEYSQMPLVIVQEGSRIELLLEDGCEVEDNHVSFDEYIDGTLARVKSGYNVSSYSINSDSHEQYEWIIMQRKSGRFNIEGGFKPNDIQAKGQRQSSSITIEYSDGVQESYLFSRRRSALPVVKFGDLYWSKFNMKGDSKLFEDQIGFEDHTADLWDYLRGCDDESYVDLAGSQYCGTNSKGLNLGKNQDGTLEYLGFSEAFGNSTINSIEAGSHCPKGYQVPTVEDMHSVVSRFVVHLLGISPGEEYQNHYMVEGERYSVERYRRNSTLSFGSKIDNAYLMRISNSNGESLVLHGLGYQSDPGVINSGYWLFGSVSDEKDQAGFNNSRNNFYMQAHSGKKSVSIRCVKSPVNYIIE